MTYTHNTASEGTGDLPTTLYKKLAWRILPLASICYAVAIIDRVNIGFAKLEMSADIGLSAAAYGLGAGIFFLAYIFFEVPSNMILERVGAKNVDRPHHGHLGRCHHRYRLRPKH